MPRRRRAIPVAAPSLTGREERYVLECLRSTWVSSRGPFIGRFERAFARFCGSAHGVACNSGTAALHLAMVALGIGPGDEVIVPTSTYIATANAVRYCGATPRFVDSTPDTWTLDPDAVKRAINPCTRAIVAVHLYGEPADMDALLELAASNAIHVVEDAAEAHGATYGGRPVGSIGAIGAFSFYGNKIITTGEGGMVVTDRPDLARRALRYRGQGQDLDRLHWFPVVGHNYRMTNIEAAIGLAQLEQVRSKLARRRAIATRYRRNLAGIRGMSFQAHTEKATPANWMVGVLLPVRTAAGRDRIAAGLLEDGIETRPFFPLVHTMPPYARSGSGGFPVAEGLAARGICLPTWTGLTDQDVDYVSERLMQRLGP